MKMYIIRILRNFVILQLCNVIRIVLSLYLNDFFFKVASSVCRYHGVQFSGTEPQWYTSKMSDDFFSFGKYLLSITVGSCLSTTS